MEHTNENNDSYYNALRVWPFKYKTDKAHRDTEYTLRQKKKMRLKNKKKNNLDCGFISTKISNGHFNSYMELQKHWRKD